MHRKEIERLDLRLQTERMTLVPLKLYLSERPGQGGAGPGKGRKTVDKRHDLAKREADREAQRAMSGPAATADARRGRDAEQGPDAGRGPAEAEPLPGQCRVDQTASTEAEAPAPVGVQTKPVAPDTMVMSPTSTVVVPDPARGRGPTRR